MTAGRQRPDSAPPPDDAAARRIFTRLWVGSTANSMTANVLTAAVPLQALTVLSYSAAQVGVLRAASLVAYFVLAVPAGFAVDRFPAIRVLLIADFTGLGLVAVLTAADVTSGLVFVVLLLLTVALGVVLVFRESIELALVRRLSTRSFAPLTMNSRIASAQSLAAILGPLVAGLLVGGGSLLPLAALAFVGFAVSLACDLGRSGARAVPANSAVVRSPAPHRGEPRGRLAEMWANPPLRLMTIYLGVNNVAVQAFQVAVLVYAVDDLHLSAAATGALLAAGGVGLLVGISSSPKVAAHTRLGPLLVAASLLNSATVLVVLLAGPGGVVFAFVGIFATELFSGMLVVQNIALRQALSPRHRVGFVNSVAKSSSMLGNFVGAIGGGALAGAVGAPAVIALAAGIGGAATVLPAAAPVRRLRQIPAVAD